MLNTVGLLVKLATAFAVASHLIDLTLFLAFSGFISNSCFICTLKKQCYSVSCIACRYSISSFWTTL